MTKINKKGNTIIQSLHYNNEWGDTGAIGHATANFGSAKLSSLAEVGLVVHRPWNLNVEFLDMPN